MAGSSPAMTEKRVRARSLLSDAHFATHYPGCLKFEWEIAWQSRDQGTTAALISAPGDLKHDVRIAAG